ncbi:MAG: ABC transporter ATP-binding protein [Thermoplasmata archaeon]|nr:ABC transporter ATP-binding protein [Thermoplasmata archaeon]
MKVIRVKDAYKSYGKVHALNGVSFECSKGLIACFGVNGSGKTTLVKLMSGLMKPDRGEFEILGKKVIKNGLPEGVGVAFERVQLPPYFQGVDFLRRICELKGVDEGEMRRVVKELKIEDIVNKRIGALSQGNRKRIAVSQAFIGEPELIILDDPFANIDIHYSLFLEDYIMRYVKEHDSTIFLTTHHLIHLKPDEYMVLSQGNLIAHRRAEELKFGKPLKYHLVKNGMRIMVEDISALKKELNEGAEMVSVDVYTYADWIKELSEYQL